MWQAFVARELAPVRLRSSRNSVGAVCQLKFGGRSRGCFAAQREQAPSPQRFMFADIDMYEFDPMSPNRLIQNDLAAKAASAGFSRRGGVGLPGSFMETT
jgi:hypothetical protein